MLVTQSHLISFSPCGGTQRVMRCFLPGLAYPVREYNLTQPLARKHAWTFGPEDLVLIGFPVFGGRLPRNADEVFAILRGDKTPTVLVAVYGNRDYEDALLEMGQLAEGRGFKPVAACAAIAEHSMAPEIAAGRPDIKDKEALGLFARKVITTLDGFAGPDAIAFTAPGQFPYAKPSHNIPIGPDTSEACTLCGDCIDVCPTGAIPKKEPNTTDIDLCIACQACVKVCPEQARTMNQPPIEKVREFLRASCLNTRREPEFFWPA